MATKKQEELAPTTEEDGAPFKKWLDTPEDANVETTEPAEEVAPAIPVMSYELSVPVVAEEGHLPTRAHESDAGFDLYAKVPYPGVILRGGQRTVIECGVRGAIPEGYVGMVCPRSGLAINQGVTILNAPGIIDAGYRGDWSAALINLNPIGSPTAVHIKPGDRVAQLVLVRLAELTLTPVDELPEGERGENGFGSTGA